MLFYNRLTECYAKEHGLRRFSVPTPAFFSLTDKVVYLGETHLLNNWICNVAIIFETQLYFGHCNFDNYYFSVGGAWRRGTHWPFPMDFNDKSGRGMHPARGAIFLLSLMLFFFFLQFLRIDNDLYFFLLFRQEYWYNNNHNIDFLVRLV